MPSSPDKRLQTSSRRRSSKAVWSFLRSRRLALAYLVGMTFYVWVVTLVPLESFGGDAVAAWDARHPLLAAVVNAFGLHQAYSSPVFIAFAVLLTASTAACAWERTRVAMRAYRARRCAMPSSALEHLRTFPAIRIELVEGVAGAEALARSTRACRRMRMRVSQTPDLQSGDSGALGLAGSPLFHWALVALFIFAAAGQLTRYEGYVNMVVGDTVLDAPSAYSADLDCGPLSSFLGFTGAEMELGELDLDHAVGGVERGRAALVRLTRGGATLKEQWVFPNSPLRYGSLSIQRANSGPILVGNVSISGDVSQEAIRLYYDESSKSPRRFSVVEPARGTTLEVEVTPLGGQKVLVAVVGEESQLATQTIGLGETATLAEGVTFTIDALTYYVQLQVVNDWSVPWIYATFVLGIIGISLTTFVPSRTIRVMVVDGPAGARLHVMTTQRKNDPAFPRRAERILREGLAELARPAVDSSEKREGDA